MGASVPIHQCLLALTPLSFFKGRRTFPLALMAVKTVSSSSPTHIEPNAGTGTVLLHLYAGALARRLSPSEPMRPIQTLYIPVPSPFSVLESFIADTAKVYNLDLFLCKPQDMLLESVVTPAPANGNGVGVDYLNSQTQRKRSVGKAKGAEGMRQALEIYKARFPHITAILVGTRRSDPHGGTYTSCMT
jgi:FAD synthetase